MTLTIRTAADLAADRKAALRAQITAAIDATVEDQARSMGYNSAAHCASYVASTVPGWAAEAQAFVAWRDATWLAAFAGLSEVEAGKTLPSIDEALARLPAWKG